MSQVQQGAERVRVAIFPSSSRQLRRVVHRLLEVFGSFPGRTNVLQAVILRCLLFVFFFSILLEFFNIIVKI